MTEHRPPACHYDRTLGERVTRHHRDDCTTPDQHRGCAPCTAPHCTICGHEHLNNSNPATCPTCVGKVREDLTLIPPAFTDLHVEALDAGGDGRLVAAAPIPGGTAAVLIGPSVRLDRLRTGSLIGMKTFTEDHRSTDPIPPLAILAQWEDLWRTHLGHSHGTRADVTRAVAYLGQQLDYMAQHTGPGVPDFPTFTRQIRTLRSRLEHALHDEQEPERGVECFECGDRLVRRFRARRTCRHDTPARRHLHHVITGRPAALARLAQLQSALDHEHAEHRPTPLSVQVARNAAALPTPVELAAARQPCSKCSQGGIDDPTAGLSWECPGCRKEYSPGEYATAVRRDLLENGAEGDGWTHIGMAAQAATTMCGLLVRESTVRKWVTRGKVSSKLTDAGARLVYWPDVADEAVEAVARAARAAEARVQRGLELEQLTAAIAAGEDPKAAGERLGIHPSRVKVMLEEIDKAAESGRISA